MKKTIITFLCLMAFSPAVLAAQEDTYREPCQYTVLQNLVRDARNHEKIFDMIRAGVSMDDETITCGGTLLQLAIRRGNPSILNGILAQDKSRINSLVPLRDFPIAGAPDKIPAILFAAYYAPSEVIFKVMLDNGANVAVKDSRGHGILWYLDRNPVLRKTATEDGIQATLQNMLLKQAQYQTAIPAPKAPETEVLSPEKDTLNMQEAPILSQSTTNK